MKESERARVLQHMKENFPERYRELVEQYMKALAEDKGAKPGPK